MWTAWLTFKNEVQFGLPEYQELPRKFLGPLTTVGA